MGGDVDDFDGDDIGLLLLLGISNALVILIDDNATVAITAATAVLVTCFREHIMVGLFDAFVLGKSVLRIAMAPMQRSDFFYIFRSLQ